LHESFNLYDSKSPKTTALEMVQEKATPSIHRPPFAYYFIHLMHNGYKQ